MDGNKTSALVKTLCNAVGFVSSGQGYLRMFTRRGRLTGRIKSLKFSYHSPARFWGCLFYWLYLAIFGRSSLFYSRIWPRSYIIYHYEAIAIQEDEAQCYRTQSVRLLDIEMIYRANYAEVPYGRCNWDEGAIWSFECWPGVSSSFTIRDLKSGWTKNSNKIHELTYMN